jgi:hypothetical protein
VVTKPRGTGPSDARARTASTIATTAAMTVIRTDWVPTYTLPTPASAPLTRVRTARTLAAAGVAGNWTAAPPERCCPRHDPFRMGGTPLAPRSMT